MHLLAGVGCHFARWSASLCNCVRRVCVAGILPACSMVWRLIPNLTSAPAHCSLVPPAAPHLSSSQIRLSSSQSCEPQLRPASQIACCSPHFIKTSGCITHTRKHQPAAGAAWPVLLGCVAGSQAQLRQEMARASNGAGCRSAAQRLTCAVAWWLVCVWRSRPFVVLRACPRLCAMGSLAFPAFAHEQLFLVVRRRWQRQAVQCVCWLLGAVLGIALLTMRMLRQCSKAEWAQQMGVTLGQCRCLLSRHKPAGERCSEVFVSLGLMLGRLTAPTTSHSVQPLFVAVALSKRRLVQMWSKQNGRVKMILAAASTC